MGFSQLLQVSAVSSFALLSATGVQAAPDAKTVSDALTATFESFGMKMTIAGAKADGENIVLQGLSVTLPPGADGQTTASPAVDVVLQNVTEDEKSYLVGEVAAPAGSYPVKDGTWEFGGASLKGARIAKNVKDPNNLAALLYDSVETKPTKFVGENGAGDLIKIGAFKATMSPFADGKPMVFDALGDIWLNAVALGKNDAQAIAVLGQFGLNEISTKIAFKGNWEPTAGTMEFTEYSLDTDKVGKFDFKVALSGYTKELMREIQELSKSATGTNSSEQGMKMMGLMQKVVFKSMSVRFDDAGITSKLLDFAAQKNGQPRDAIVSQVKGMAPMMVMQLGDGNLTAAVSTAVNSFIDNPKSLEIKLAPKEPVPVSLITAMGMSQPQALVQQLGLTVVANQ